MPFLSEATRAALLRLAAADGAGAAGAGADAATGGGVGAPDPLERLAGIRSLIAELERDPATLTAVRDALAGGATWQQVADAAGLGAAAAKWRWQGSDDEIAARQDAGRKRAARPSSVPTDLPGHSVAEAAEKLGVSAQAVYLRITRGTLRSETVELADGRKYKRVFLDEG